MSKAKLKYVETEGGPFILLPLEQKSAWKGSGDEDDEDEESDYDRAEAFLTTVGVLDVGKGRALILGEAEITAFRPTEDGGVFVQKVIGDDPSDVKAALDGALKSGKWKLTKHVLPIAGDGKLALFDAAYAYADADKDEVLKLTLPPGTYAVETARVETDDVELGLVRLRRK